MQELGAPGRSGASRVSDARDHLTVGPYRLLARIGEGGMGVVHLAERSDGSRVAIKLLRPHIVGDDHGRARMAREVTSLRRVRSPRVAEVYDSDPWGNTPYVVVRHVAGPSLHDHVARHGPIRGDDLIVLARGLAEALVAVHRADVLHRDVKPSNVLLEGRDPVLIDFGLAQLSDDSKLTHSGWLLGTPGYLAPEILYGDEPTPKADVHSWAATLVFAATGRGPYGKGPAVAVMDRVRRGEYDLTGVPDELAWVVTRGLMPDPRDRPTSGQLLDWMTVGRAVPGRPVPPRRSAVSQQQPVSAVMPTPVMSGPAPAQTAAFWFCLLAVVVVGAVTAPGVTAIMVFAAAWLLRTVAFQVRRLEQWQRARGPRPGDGMVAIACLPWFGLLTLPKALFNAGVAVAGGAVVVVIATIATDPKRLVPVLALGGVVTALFTWWGPFSREVRAGGRVVARRVLLPSVAGVLVVALVATSAAGLLIVRQVVGPDYEPLPRPPWEESLRDLVN